MILDLYHYEEIIVIEIIVKRIRNLYSADKFYF